MSKLDEIVGKSAAHIGEEVHEWLEKKSATPTRQEIPQIHLSFEEQRTLQTGQRCQAGLQCALFFE